MEAATQASVEPRGASPESALGWGDIDQPDDPELVDFVLSAAGQAILANYGFSKI
jgi:hypothetical protein